MTLRRTLAAAAFALATGIAALPASAQQTPPAAPSAQAQRPYANQLMTQEERDAYRKQMQEAKTPEERTKIRDEAHAQAQARAKEKGITLPEPRGPRGPKPAPAPAPEAPKAQ